MEKNIYNIFKSVGLVLVLVLFLSSCDKWVDTEINIDPDAPADVPLNLLLPAIEQSIGYNMLGNNSVRTNNIWMQLFDGVDRQSFTEARYQLTPADVNNLWNSMYTEMFMNSKVLIDKAILRESPHNEGVGKVLIATTLGMATDLWGSMPFSEAFQGSENNLTPVFDSQQEIYQNIFTLLTEAASSLGAATDPIGIGGDIIYGGNAGKWVKAANSIMARHKLQLSKVNGNTAYTEALAAANAGFTSNADDFEVPFETANKNPIFQFMEQRTDIRMGKTLFDMMDAQDDPRIPFYFDDPASGGSAPGSENTGASYPGSYNAAADAPTVLMSYAELKFIQAECYFMLGQTANAQTAFEAAVAASVLRVTGNANTAWLAANINGTALTLQKIIEQKYIALYSTNQPYADWRRTGFPVLGLAAGAKLNEIPRRFPYAQSEITYNGANVPAVVITDRLWWDN